MDNHDPPSPHIISGESKIPRSATVPIREKDVQKAAEPKQTSGQTRKFASKDMQIELAKKDYDRISQEIIQKRTCQGTFFLATLAAMSTAAFALIALASESTPDWMWLGTLVPLVMLTISMLAGIQKARAINLRLGYLANLSSHLAANNMPRYYAGWENALRAALLCNAIRTRTKKNETPCLRDSGAQCRDKAQERTRDEIKAVQMWRTQFLKSFTVFTSVIYAVLFLCWSVAFVWFAVKRFDLPVKPVIPSAILGLIMVGMVAFVGYWFIRTGQIAREKAEKNRSSIGCDEQARSVAYHINTAVTSLSDKLGNYCNLLFILGGISFVIALVWRVLLSSREAGSLLVVSFVFLLFGVALRLYLSFYALRKGENSVEFMCNLWHFRFKQCPWMSGRRIWRAGDVVHEHKVVYVYCCNCDAKRSIPKSNPLGNCDCDSHVSLYYTVPSEKNAVSHG